MLGRPCQRETEERQKERVGQMVGLVGQTARCQRCFQKGDASLSPTSIAAPARGYQPRAGVSIPQEGKPGSIPKRRNVDPRPLLPPSVEQWEA